MKLVMLAFRDAEGKKTGVRAYARYADGSPLPENVWRVRWMEGDRVREEIQRLADMSPEHRKQIDKTTSLGERIGGE